MSFWKRFLIAMGFGAAVFVGVLFAKDVFHEEETYRLFQSLSDAAFVPAVLLICYGALVLATKGGTFDMLVYGVSCVFSVMKRDPTRKYKTFYDYRVAQNEKPRSFWYLMLAGVVFLAISVVFLTVYYHAIPPEI